MSDELSKQAELIDWLRQRGHTPGEIDKILAKIAEYDEKTIRESIFDSIDDGTFDMASLIKEALSDGEEA